MSDAKPDLGDLGVELDVLGWPDVQKLSLKLQMNYSDLEVIAKQKSDASSRLLATMNLWLTTDPGATWGRVVRALRDIKQPDLANELEDRYCNPTAAPSPLATVGRSAGATQASPTHSSAGKQWVESFHDNKICFLFLLQGLEMH